MSERLAADLKGFTPTAPDRDALLYAAGRASARRWAGWKWLAAGLAVTNAVSLAVLLWPKPAPTLPAVEPLPSDVEPEPVRPDPNSYLALTWGLDRPAVDPGPPVPANPLTPRAVLDPRFQ